MTPLLLAIPISARVIQVLQDFLPAELDLVDTEAADGEPATPDIPNPNYSAVDQAVVGDTPGITMQLLPTEIAETLPELMGRRADQQTRLDVKVHVRLEDADQDQLRLQTLTLRYVTGIYRVLAIKKEGLQTSADNTRFAEIVELAGPIDPGPAGAQGVGVLVRTGTVPITVRRRETIV